MADIDDLVARRLCQAGDVVLDVGAYQGETVQRYLDSGARMVHAFEPHPDSFALIVKRFAREPAVFPHNLALGDVDGPVEFAGPVGKVEKSSIDTAFGRRAADAMAIGIQNRTVPCARLDSLALGPTDFWKLDAEGAENQIIAGAERTLQDTPPRILQAEIFSMPYNEKGYQPRTIANIRRYFAHCCLAGITETGELGLYRLEPRSRDEGETAIKASRRGGPPTFVFSHEPLV